MRKYPILAFNTSQQFYCFYHSSHSSVPKKKNYRMNEAFIPVYACTIQCYKLFQVITNNCVHVQLFITSSDIILVISNFKICASGIFTLFWEILTFVCRGIALHTCSHRFLLFLFAKETIIITGLKLCIDIYNLMSLVINYIKLCISNYVSNYRG